MLLFSEQNKKINKLFKNKLINFKKILLKQKKRELCQVLVKEVQILKLLMNFKAS